LVIEFEGFHELAGTVIVWQTVGSLVDGGLNLTAQYTGVELFQMEGRSQRDPDIIIGKTVAKEVSEAHSDNLAFIAGGVEGGIVPDIYVDHGDAFASEKRDVSGGDIELEGAAHDGGLHVGAVYFRIRELS